MNIAFYGKGKLGTKAYYYLKRTDSINVLCTCSDQLDASGDSKVVFAEQVTDISEIPSVDLKTLAMLARSGEIDAVIVATDNELLDYVIKRLVTYGMVQIAILPSYYEEDYLITDESFMWIETYKPRMPYLEYHISFQCNLKCSGCTHFSNIVNEPRFGNLDKYFEDLIRLQELFWGIGKIRLMGGEPLLNHELPDFLYATRDAFPDADIRVVSNGLMLRDSHVELLSAMRNTATFFDVSMYPPTIGAIDRISEICSANGVKLTVTPEVKLFTAGMNTHGNTEPLSAYEVCPASHCAYLCEGRISTCAMPQLIDIYNERFGTDICPGVSDVSDLYEDGLTGIELLRRLKSPMEICRFCDPVRRSFDWHVSADPDASEWIGER